MGREDTNNVYVKYILEVGGWFEGVHRGKVEARNKKHQERGNK
jgi:hypothetical protein